VVTTSKAKYKEETDREEVLRRKDEKVSFREWNSENTGE